MTAWGVSLCALVVIGTLSVAAPVASLKVVAVANTSSPTFVDISLLGVCVTSFDRRVWAESGNTSDAASARALRGGRSGGSSGGRSGGRTGRTGGTGGTGSSSTYNGYTYIPASGSSSDSPPRACTGVAGTTAGWPDDMLPSRAGASVFRDAGAEVYARGGPGIFAAGCLLFALSFAHFAILCAADCCGSWPSRGRALVLLCLAQVVCVCCIGLGAVVSVCLAAMYDDRSLWINRPSADWQRAVQGASSVNLTVTVRDSVRVGHFTALPGAVYGLATAWIAWAFFAQLVPPTLLRPRHPGQTSDLKDLEMASMSTRMSRVSVALRGRSV